MADSSKENADYARLREAPATSELVAKIVPSGRHFRPRLWPTLAAALLVPLFISAGQWQWNKASLKSERQQEFNSRATETPIAMPTTRVDAASLLYRKIVAQGYYEPQHQVLIDNLTHHQQAGYHVITPLRVDGSDIRLLVNRGWVPGLADHRHVPQIDTPTGRVEISGTAIVPSTRFYALGQESSNAPSAAQSVWQNLDLQRYGQTVSFPIQPVVIQLDPGSTAGGFIREWRRLDDRLQTNLNYAIQWWSFAATTVMLWLVLNFRKSS